MIMDSKIDFGNLSVYDISSKERSIEDIVKSVRSRRIVCNSSTFLYILIILITYAIMILLLHHRRTINISIEEWDLSDLSGLNGEYDHNSLVVISEISYNDTVIKENLADYLAKRIGHKLFK